MRNPPEMPSAGSLASGSAQTAEVIRQETVRLCAERYRGRLRSVVLTGSLARDEATIIEEPGGRRLLGDAEFLLIFQEATELPAEHDIHELSHRIEESLLAHSHLSAHITLSAGKARYLTTLHPHIFAFELRECGRVAWGDPLILSLIPSFHPSEIPLEDAWRLLSNRIVEQLDLVAEPAAGSLGESREARYRTLKLYLDMATSFLLFTGAYAPTYRQRAENLSQLARQDRSAERWPFALQDFAERVARSTRLKLGRGASTPSALIEDPDSTLLDWSEAVSYARRLWRWELARLARTDPTLDESALMGRWMQAQPLRERLWGWLYVARRTGWWRGWRLWPRWAKQGWRASPRYWIYSAASELVFRLPDVLRGTTGRTPLPLEALEAALPVVGRAAAGTPTPWRRLATDIMWNYRQFLVDTRS